MAIEAILPYKNMTTSVMFNSVYLPPDYRSGYYDSISGVNQFGVLFNTLFKTDYPLLKDSAKYLLESEDREWTNNKQAMKKNGFEKSNPFLVDPDGIEPSTYWLWVNRSNQLS